MEQYKHINNSKMYRIFIGITRKSILNVRKCSVYLDPKNKLQKKSRSFF